MSYVAWIEDGLAKRPDKTKSGIAAAIGVDKSQVSRLLKGGRRLRADEVGKIAAYLEIPPPSGFAEDDAPFEGRGREAPLVPIYRVVANSSGGWSIERHEEPIDLKPRAPHFANAARVFGFYAPDDAMAPRFKPGEIAWVDPARPAKPGDDVALIGQVRSRGPEPIILAELRAATADEIAIVQHKDGAPRSLDARRWTAFLVLPRY